MIIDINFFYGGIGKYRRHRELQQKEDGITTKLTMFIEGYNLLDLAKRLKLVDNVEEISYQEYTPERLNVEGRTIFWYNPSKQYPEKTFNEIPVQFECPYCNSNDDGTGHHEECEYQNKNTLICKNEWVVDNIQALENANLIDSDNTVKYISLPNCEIREKRPTIVNRITIKKRYGNSYAYFHIYDNLRIRIEKLPFTTDWKDDANWIINYLNKDGKNLFDEDLYFDEEFSFVSQILENKRLFDKNDKHLGIKVDSKKISNSQITQFKTRLGEENKYDVNVTRQYFSFEDVFLKGLEEKMKNYSDKDNKRYGKYFKEVKVLIKKSLAKSFSEKKTGFERNPDFYDLIFKQNFIELKEIIHSTGAIQRFYKTLTFEDKYLNILFIDCANELELKVKEGKQKKAGADEVFEERKDKFIKSFVENFKLEKYYQQRIQMTNLEELDTYIISNREIKIKSVKHCLKLDKEPPISDKKQQPFNRGLFPYSFKGRVLYPNTVLDHIGFQKDGLYYPYCKMAKPKPLKKYIKALIQGFPKDMEEAKKYGIDWDEEKGWVDEKSAVLPKCEIKKGIFIKVEKNGRVIKPLGKIDIEKFKEKFEECAKEKSSQLDRSEEVNNVEFSFLRPLTIDTLFTISNKKIAAQVIPEESLIAYCYDKKVYYMFKGKTLKAPYDCKENGHGYIHNKKFFPMDYHKCECKENILQYCESRINRSLLEHKIKKILIFTESEGFYWNNNGYKELMCNVNIKSDKKSLYKIEIKDENNEPFPIQLAPSTKVKIRKNLRSTLKEFPRNFFYEYDLIKKNTQLEKQRNKKYKSPFGFNEVLVNGVYNDFGKLYWGTPLNRVGRKKAGYDSINTNEQDLKKEDYKQKIQRMITNKGLNEKYIKSCFRRKNIENFIKIANPIEIDFFIKSSTLFNLKLKIFKINVPFSNEENLKRKISNFTRQFIDKTIDNFDQSAVIFYDNGNSINYHYSQ